MPHNAITVTARVWKSKNAFPSPLPVKGGAIFPFWKTTELRAILDASLRADAVTFEISDFGSEEFFSKLSISPQMSPCILRKPDQTAGQLRRSAIGTATNVGFFESQVRDNTASVILLPVFKQKEDSEKKRTITINALRGGLIVSQSVIEFRIYSKHSGTRSTHLSERPSRKVSPSTKTDSPKTKAKSASTKRATEPKKTTIPIASKTLRIVEINTRPEITMGFPWGSEIAGPASFLPTLTSPPILTSVSFRPPVETGMMGMGMGMMIGGLFESVEPLPFDTSYILSEHSQDSSSSFSSSPSPPSSPSSSSETESESLEITSDFVDNALGDVAPDFSGEEGPLIDSTIFLAC